jgi:cytochrome P450
MRYFLVAFGWWVVGAAAAVAAWLMVGPGPGIAVLAIVFGPFLVKAGFLAWRARPEYGTDEGLPPGRISVGPETLLDFEFFGEQIRRYGPVTKANYFADPLLCIADLDLATSWFRMNSDALGHRPLPYNRHVPEGAIRWAAEPRHTDLRRLFSRALSPQLIRVWDGEMRRAVCAQLDDAAAVGAADPSGIAPRDRLREAARQVCAGLLLGLGVDDPAYPEVREHMFALDICRPYPVSDAETTERLDRLADLVKDRVARRAPDDLPTVAAAMERLEPGVLDDVGFVRNLVYLALGPRDDITGLLVWLTWYLSMHPEWLTAVAAAPDSDVIDRIISETLRLDQSEYLFRITRRSLAIGEYTVPAGWPVRVCIREIHRDPKVFPEPLRFDPDRFTGDAIGRAQYSPLGIDHKSCIGEGLTRAMASAYIRTLACDYDISVVSDGPRELSWNTHWAPAEAFRVHVERRVSADRTPTDQP